MHSILSLGARTAPLISPEHLQAARISARVRVSPSVAGVLALHAYGQRRDHGTMLAGLVAARGAEAAR